MSKLQYRRQHGYLLTASQRPDGFRLLLLPSIRICNYKNDSLNLCQSGVRLRKIIKDDNVPRCGKICGVETGNTIAVYVFTEPLINIWCKYCVEIWGSFFKAKASWQNWKSQLSCLLGTRAMCDAQRCAVPHSPTRRTSHAPTGRRRLFGSHNIETCDCMHAPHSV
jgi:hypothetical protein